MEFVDIAGIVKGASEGAGLGNKFLSNIRQTDAIIHVVRCFEDDDIIHVDGSVDPLRDVDVINIELALTDMNQIEKRLEKCKKDKFKTNSSLETQALERIYNSLSDNIAARFVDLSPEEKVVVSPLMLLTMKPVSCCKVCFDEGFIVAELVNFFNTTTGYKYVYVSIQSHSHSL